MLSTIKILNVHDKIGQRNKAAVNNKIRHTRHPCSLYSIY